MSAVYDFLGWLAGRYELVFADWLYIHFALRTLILLLLVWAAVFLAAQVFKYAVGPLLVLFWYHVVFRAWNYLFVETFMEWIYIHYFSYEKKFLSQTYLKLCDTVRNNRLRLDYTRYRGILRAGGVARAGRRLMIITLTAATLWVLAFGLYQQYGQPVYAEKESSAAETPAPTPVPAPKPTPAPTPTPQPAALFFEGANYFMLNEYGIDGANVRDKPDGTVITVLSGNAVMMYLGEYEQGADDGALFWLKIQTDNGLVGYISSKIVAVAG